MQQIVQDPNKTALIQAVQAGLADNPVLALRAVAKLSPVLPVYLNAITDLETAAQAMVDYFKGAGPAPDWYKHATQA